jgi:AcrR family transcriptional regulator
MPRRTHAEMTATTRAALLAEARTAFLAHGYAGAPIDEVVARAGLTKGALYHHFGSKLGLFEAVVDELYRDLEARPAPLDPTAPAPWRELLAACRGFLEGLLAPGVRRLLLVDGPAALGPARARALDRDRTVTPLVAALRSGPATARLADPEAVAHVINGALIGVAQWMDEAADPREALDRGLAVVRELLVSLLGRPPRPPARHAPRAVRPRRR